MDMLKTHFSIEQLSLGPSCGGRWLDAKVVAGQAQDSKGKNPIYPTKPLEGFFCRFFSVGLLFQGIYLKKPSLKINK